MNEEVIRLPFDVERPPVQELRAGRLSCLYEQGNLRTIRIGSVEIIRMVYGAVRDDMWQTAPYEIREEKVETTSDTFSISYIAYYELNAIRYKAHFQIKGAADSTIRFYMQGEALSSFNRNRIGICVLHPVRECTGKEAVVIKEDGTTYTASFPDTISPHQPFLDIQQLKYKLGNFDVSLHFEGAVFETEDQRNWTDSSFKTYSTPLRLPYPVFVKEGETISQKVTLSVLTTDQPQKDKTANKDKKEEQKVPFPRIGFSRNPAHGLLKKFEIEQLKKLPFHHYRVELHLDAISWKEELQQAATEAALLETTIELIVFFNAGSEAEMQELITTLHKRNVHLCSILLLSKNEKTTPKAVLQEWYPVLKQTFSNLHIGYGTDGNFADLNRARPGDIPHDFVSFSLYPQVHASDMRSILENLETQHHTLQTTRTFSKKPVHLSPVTFAQRNTTDVRQHTSVAAWWTLKTLQNLGAANRITFYQTTGPGGILQRPTEAFSIYKVFEKLKAFGPAWVIQKGGEPSIYDPVVFENSAGDRLQFVLDNKNGGMGF